MEYTLTEKAERAELVLQASPYLMEDNGPVAVADILADLRHLCRREGWDFHGLDQNAHNWYLRAIAKVKH